MKTLFLLFLLVISNLVLSANNETYNLKLLHYYNESLSSQVKSIDCIDENNCILLHIDDQGTGMIAEKTTDGGISWKIVYADSSSDNLDYLSHNFARYCKYYSDGTVVLAGDIGIVRSEDFGETFQACKIDNFSYYSMEMDAGKNGVVISIKNTADPKAKFGTYISTDGFKTWKEINVPDSIAERYDFYTVQFQKNKNIILNYWTNFKSEYHETFDSTKSYRFKTDLNGSYWQKLITPRYIDSYYFISSSEAIGVGRIQITQAFGDTALVHKTYDGGQTWVEKFRSTSPYHCFSSLNIYSDTLIMIYGKGFGFFKSTDKGESWYMPKFNLEENIINGVYLTSGVKLLENGNFYMLTALDAHLIKGEKIESSVPEPSVKPKKIYPNPITQGCEFTSEYEIENSGLLKIYISDISGKEIGSLYSTYAEKGFYSTHLKLPDYISSGSYWLNMEMNGFRHVQMLNVVR